MLCLACLYNIHENDIMTVGLVLDMKFLEIKIAECLSNDIMVIMWFKCS